MCGFAGVVTWDEKYRVTRDTLEKMSRAIAHRGPDGEGYHLTHENEPITPDTPQIGLAFRRLAILDPDPRSNQPFHIGPLTLVFNGEIYNFRELKSEISKLRPDYRWRTTGDTEVLLMAYEVWREKCVEKLNGMFAFAVWDEDRGELFTAQDRMGQKPLYCASPFDIYAAMDDMPMPVIAFASEPSALQTLNWLEFKVDIENLLSYLRYGYASSLGRCALERIRRDRPSGRICYQRSKHGVGGMYFDQNAAAPSTIDPVAATRTLVRQAVERQLISDVPLGIFLSGGVDSSIITSAARAFGPVQTFSIGFDDPRYDEAKYATEVAKHLGTKHHHFVVRPKAAEDLPMLAKFMGEPFADSSALPTHHLARETRKHVKVALSGDGGDELFGGYDRYRAMWLATRARFLRVLQPVSHFLPGGDQKARTTRAKRFLGSLNLPAAARYDSYMRFFDDALLNELINDSVRRSIAFSNESFGKVSPKGLEIKLQMSREQTIAGLFEKLATTRDEVTAALAVDRITYLPYDLLTKVDRCSMLHGLEVRSPFMDHELVQFAAGLTTDQLLKGGPKRMLREAFANDLPDFVFKRKKMGFAVPIGEWFRGELRPMLRDNLFAQNAFGRTHFNMKVVERLVEEHETERVDHSQRLYALLMLELWWQQQGK